MRLRIFDWANRWFWIVVFYQRIYGEPFFVLEIFTPAKRNWLYLWTWEARPNRQGAGEVEKA